MGSIDPFVRVYLLPGQHKVRLYFLIIYLLFDALFNLQLYIAKKLCNIKRCDHWSVMLYLYLKGLVAWCHYFCLFVKFYSACSTVILSHLFIRRNSLRFLSKSPVSSVGKTSLVFLRTTNWATPQPNDLRRFITKRLIIFLIRSWRPRSRTRTRTPSSTRPSSSW